MKLAHLAAFALALSGSSMIGMGRWHDHKNPLGVDETNAERKKRLARNDSRINKDRGLTEFIYGDNKLWALNKKSADKKAKRLGWI